MNRTRDFGELLEGVEIMRTGTHQASSGMKLTFSVADLQALAAAYDPSFHEAPVTVGHPKDNKPSYGWVRSLSVSGNKLLATLDCVPQFVEALRQGLFRKRSASIYPDLDGKGQYLRHVGFLGAMPPAVKALADLNLCDGKESVSFEFDEEGENATSTHTREEYPMSWKQKAKALFGQAVDEIPEAGATQVVHVLPAQPAGAGGDRLPVSFSEDDVKRREKAAAEKARKDAELEFAEKTRTADADRKAETHRVDVKTKIETMVNSKEGRVIPAMVKAGLIEFAQSLPFADDHVFEFAEDGKQVKKTPCDWLLETLLPMLPKQVDFEEFAGGKTDVSGDVEKRREKLIQDFMEKNNSLSYRDAVLEVSAKNPELFRH